MGDYYTSLACVANIDLSLKSLYWKLPSYYVTLFYYLGFSYMMLKRYDDCIRTLSQMLIFLTKQRSYLVSQSYQQGAITKLTEKMYQLLIICHAITKIRLDESIIQTIKEQYSNRFYQLQSDNEDAFKDAFLKACPKFIDPACTIAKYGMDDSRSLDDHEDDIDITGNATNEPVQRQIDLFLIEVANQRKVDEICSFAKLYHNINMEKLAALMKLGDDMELVRSYILFVKQLTRQFVNNSTLGNPDALPSTGERDVDLYIENDVLHIKSRRNEKTYADYFTQQINKCKQTLRTLQSKREENLQEALR
ncbi:Translation initiation factor 3 complex subunit L [Babesia duncani]|uniref:Translation initiation factor 3 complex subunit L n=1 Tax=Babesia duncani TaxID=323732 RepID=A0AAD9UQA8_9APIC|nr:Translation initiation factor 3 complex subunit L [Babesia duncani]